MNYLGLKSGQVYRIPIGKSELYARVPSGEAYLYLNALHSYHTRVRASVGLNGNEDVFEVGPNDSFDRDFNSKLCKEIIVRPESFDPLQLGAAAWVSGIRPILRSFAGFERVGPTPSIDELIAMRPGDEIEVSFGSVPVLDVERKPTGEFDNWKLKFSMPDTYGAERVRAMLPGIGGGESVEELSNEWKSFIKNLFKTVKAEVVSPEDRSIDGDDWLEWPAPRVAAVVDYLIYFTGLRQPFQATPNLQLVDPTDIPPESSNQSESSLGDDQGPTHHATATGHESDSDVGVGADVADETADAGRVAGEESDPPTTANKVTQKPPLKPKRRGKQRK